MKKTFLTTIIFLFLLNGTYIATANNSQGEFGEKQKKLFSFKGKIYFIEKGTSKLPDFSKLKPVGEIYTDVLNIEPRYFSQGFPGITDRFEWFAIKYNGNFFLPHREKIKFFLLSDDGSKLIIDGKCIINNDGIHPPKKISNIVELNRGLHKIEVQYFQGPRYQVALVLSYEKNGKEVLFNLKDFIPFKIKERKCEVLLTIGSGILFDFNKYELKENTKELLEKITEELKEIEVRKIIIEGHTDSIGSKTYNLELSKKRADPVKDFLVKNGIPEETIKTVGFGEEKPIASNKTEEGRAKNRRVEIRILEECKRENTKKLTLKDIEENPEMYRDRIVELEGYAKGWMVKAPEEINKLFLTLPFARKNTGLSRNWGSFTDGTAVILFPIAPTKFGKFKIKAKVKLNSKNEWYLEVIKMEPQFSTEK